VCAGTDAGPLSDRDGTPLDCHIPRQALWNAFDGGDLGTGTWFYSTGQAEPTNPTGRTHTTAHTHDPANSEEYTCAAHGHTHRHLYAGAAYGHAHRYPYACAAHGHAYRHLYAGAAYGYANLHKHTYSHFAADAGRALRAGDAYPNQYPNPDAGTSDAVGDGPVARDPSALGHADQYPTAHGDSHPHTNSHADGY